MILCCAVFLKAIYKSLTRAYHLEACNVPLYSPILYSPYIQNYARDYFQSQLTNQNHGLIFALIWKKVFSSTRLRAVFKSRELRALREIWTAYFQGYFYCYQITFGGSKLKRGKYLIFSLVVLRRLIFT